MDLNLKQIFLVSLICAPYVTYISEEARTDALETCHLDHSEAAIIAPEVLEQDLGEPSNYAFD